MKAISEILRNPAFILNAILTEGVISRVVCVHAFNLGNILKDKCLGTWFKLITTYADPGLFFNPDFEV